MGTSAPGSRLVPPAAFLNLSAAISPLDLARASASASQGHAYFAQLRPFGVRINDTQRFSSVVEALAFRQ